MFKLCGIAFLKLQEKFAGSFRDNLLGISQSLDDSLKQFDRLSRCLVHDNRLKRDESWNYQHRVLTSSGARTLKAAVDQVEQDELQLFRNFHIGRYAFVCRFSNVSLNSNVRIHLRYQIKINKDGHGKL